MCARSSGPSRSLPGAHGVALALNERGVNEALASGVAEVATVVSATEEHSQANANRSRDQAIANVKRLCELRDASAHKPIVNAAISMALGCSIAGPVDPKEVIKLVEKCLEAGVDFVAIADTVGYAGPKQVGELTKAIVKLSGSKPVCVHLHDTRGMGIANASAALDAGARILDGSLGGLGGCPFAPGATGNVVFEDLVFLCESKGFATGIDIDRNWSRCARSCDRKCPARRSMAGSPAPDCPTGNLAWRPDYRLRLQAAMVQLARLDVRSGWHAELFDDMKCSVM